ncbi:hypothetical protein COOONC_22593 [Cooperia oncophora]
MLHVINKCAGSGETDGVQIKENIFHKFDFIKVFGPKAKGELVGMGGVDKVAVALSQIPTADLFGIEMKLSDEETEHMIAVLEGILNGSTDELTSNEAADFRFFVQKLQVIRIFQISVVGLIKVNEKPDSFN